MRWQEVTRDDLVPEPGQPDAVRPRACADVGDPCRRWWQMSLQHLDGSGELQQAGTTLQPILLVAIHVMLKSPLRRRVIPHGSSVLRNPVKTPANSNPCGLRRARSSMSGAAASRPTYGEWPHRRR